MFITKKKLSFIDVKQNVTKDGEKYLSLSCLDMTDNAKKYSFITKDPQVIDKFPQNLNIGQLSEIEVTIGFERVFNPKTRFSSWQPVLLGVA